MEKYKRNIGIIAICLLVGLAWYSIWLFYQVKDINSNLNPADLEIKSFEECLEKGYPILESYPRQCRTSVETFVEQIGNRTEIEQYFMEEMWRRAVENMDGRMPIEGFDARLFMGAYPGMEEEDFNGVDAINGEWKIVNGELEFVMAGSELITSADGTINEQGMKELLSKLESRLKIYVNEKEDVDSLIDRLE